MQHDADLDPVDEELAGAEPLQQFRHLGQVSGYCIPVVTLGHLLTQPHLFTMSRPCKNTCNTV